jgi:hypothetical protein
MGWPGEGKMVLSLRHSVDPFLFRRCAAGMVSAGCEAVLFPKVRYA